MLDAWRPVETLPPLGKDEVQIWRVDLPGEHTPPEEYSHRLLPEERTRAERLRAGQVRLQFVVARAVLRTLLGNCLSLDPRDVPITLARYGKPETPGVFFNLAHSGAAVLIALCREHPVGIDIEHIGREVEALEIAKSSFTSEEYAALSSIADHGAQRLAFLRCWTRKEAVVKADGRGLSLSLDSFEVPVGDSAGRQMVISVSGSAAVVHYCVRDIFYGDEVAAAWAIAAPHSTPACFIFPLAMVARKG
jgi:4'-phosphopantetheinyl transferase